jgi:hypothetical protein
LNGVQIVSFSTTVCFPGPHSFHGGDVTSICGQSGEKEGVDALVNYPPSLSLGRNKAAQHDGTSATSPLSTTKLCPYKSITPKEGKEGLIGPEGG